MLTAQAKLISAAKHGLPYFKFLGQAQQNKHVA